MEKSVRLAIESDVDVIFDIRTSVTENHLSREQLAARGITSAVIRDTIAAAPCAWMAMADGQPAGFAMADAEEGSVFALFVCPQFEGLGLGRMLLAEAEAFLFATHETLWLETGAASRAFGFYRKAGWVPVSEAGEGDMRLEKRRP